MKKNILSILLLILIMPIYAQIGISTDTPNSSALLDIVSTSKGLLITRMSTTQKTSIANPAHSLLVYDTDKKCISQNIGSETTPAWTCLALFNKQFFYMPSVNINTDVLNTNLTINLYTQYQSEFGTPLVNNPGATATSIPHYLSNELYYYITYYDPSVIQINSISDAGMMSYKVLKAADFDAYMNVVFVIK